MNDWRSYDPVATTYARVHAPRLAEPAMTLLDMAAVGEGQRVLDIGAGTGVVTAAGAARGSRMIGVDPSLGMLSVGRGNGAAVSLVAADVIDLPFPAGTFDAVVGGFVLAHFTKVETALFDLSRVTKPGGTMAFSAWADRDDAFMETWLELIASVVPKPMLAPTLADAIPGHDRFRRRDVAEQTLYDAGLRKVRSSIATFSWTYPQDEYIDGLTVWAAGRFTRSMLGEAGWEGFLQRARTTFAERFPDPLHDTRSVLFVSGVRT